MFDPSPKPRIFALPPGADFPGDLARGLAERAQGPVALARSQVIVNTTRMRRRLNQAFDSGNARLLPRITLLSELDDPAIPAAVPELQRRLELVRLIKRLLDSQPDLAPRSSLFELADSLAVLLDEMESEGVAPEALAQLDVTDASGHWVRSLEFIGIAQQFFDNAQDAPGPAARQRLVIGSLLQTWQAHPPAHPILLAGSTGSRGMTHQLMRAVARLPQGAIILPGFDFHMPDSAWDQLDKGTLAAEDHPQYRYRRLLRDLGLTAIDVVPWVSDCAALPDRNRLISLALRPAPVTDQWLHEGPHLDRISSALAQVTLLEAPTRREEALAIAMRMREAIKHGERVALISPDRMLTRRVTAALDRWGILPDDSAGTPLHLSPPGRLLRQTASLFQRKTSMSSLLALLKHPLTHSGSIRGQHLLWTRDLELYLRREGVAFPDASVLEHWAMLQEGRNSWASWVAKNFTDQNQPGQLALTDRVARHLVCANAIANGSEGTDTSALWDQAAGRAARALFDDIARHGSAAGEVNAADYADLIGALLSREEVRDRDAPHPDILIWGTLEARVMGADALILGGLNEGSWPGAPGQDPWLNRKMRAEAGLLLPDRQIGLSAHDFQQAVGAKSVWLTRAKRSDDAETVPSRWLNRMLNLLNGLPDQGGGEALDDMRARGDAWLDRAASLEHAPQVPPYRRPAPKPPLSARPVRLSVTEIQRLIRDPYAIYARHVLRLKPLDPLDRAPDAMMRGIAIHGILEHVIQPVLTGGAIADRAGFLNIAKRVLSETVPWPMARLHWQARLDSVVDWFLQTEAERQTLARPIRLEARGAVALRNPPFTLSATADRIDLTGEGQILVYDYKTGKPPSQGEQTYFDKQLLLEAAMIEQGGFEGIEGFSVAGASYIGLGRSPEIRAAPIVREPPAKIWAEFTELITRYFDPDQGFLSRRAMRNERDEGHYDQLARFGEWDATADAEGEDLT